MYSPIADMLCMIIQTLERITSNQTNVNKSTQIKRVYNYEYEIFSRNSTTTKQQLLKHSQ
jgi:hypothetical protein